MKPSFDSLSMPFACVVSMLEFGGVRKIKCSQCSHFFHEGKLVVIFLCHLQGLLLEFLSQAVWDHSQVDVLSEAPADSLPYLAASGKHPTNI